ncbi:MAG TPA: FAD-dependent oxidoreductase, partial [Caldimonas sp.]|nr:FAD-dependent oxidoreductase [Caldimonas sp.]
ANLPHILTLCKADDALLPISTVRLPRRADGPLDDAWNLCFEPWPKVGSRMPLENWLAANKADRFSPQLLRLAVHLDSTNSTPRPMLRAFIGAWQRVAAIDTTGSAFTGMLLVLLTLVKFLLGLLCLFELARPTDDERKTGQGEIAALATVLRWVARCAWGGANQRPETALVGELLELLTTIAIGLDMTGLFPTWAIADPSKLPEGEYVDWIRALQTQDDVSIQEWLQRYGVAPGFAESSRILDAVTAGLFTTPDQIAAGTFINGFGRLFLNYVTAPFKRLVGGTGEAVIGPMYQALKDRGVNVQLGYAVTQLSIVSDVVQSVTYQELLDSDSKEFKKWGPAIHDGWPDTERTCPPIQPPQKPVPFYAQAYVLAIPPFDGTIPGLPDPLKKRLAGIEHCATVGLQSWATGDALYPASLISGIAAPLRCTAAMDHLVEGNFKKPVYACGEIDDGAAKDWRPNGKAPAEWRKQYAGRLQAGTPSSIFVSVNATASERYVKANPKTQKARPHVFETGVKNLWLAGDWTRTALSCGSIEAAVTSGLEAARDILQKLDCTVNFKIVASILREKEYDQKTRA